MSGPVRPMKSDQSEDNTMRKSPPRSHRRWTQSERTMVAQMKRNGVPIAEIAARFDRTYSSTMLCVLSRAPAPRPIQQPRARKFGRRALELGTFLLLLGFCFAVLVLL